MTRVLQKISGSMLLILLFLFFSPNFSFAQETEKNNAGSNQRLLPDFKSLPQVAWKFKSTKPFIGSPVMDDHMVYVGGLDSLLYALNAHSGALEWKFKTNGAIRSTVCISGAKLFLFSGDGNLYCLNKANGDVNWTFKTSGDHQYDVYDYHQSSPVVYKGAVYFGSGDGYLYAVNMGDGKQLWKFQTANVIHSTPAISDDKLFFGSMDGYVYAINILNGRFIWKFKTVGHNYFPKGEVQFSPTVLYGTVFIGARDYNLYAIDVNTGVCHWNREFPGGWVPAVTPSYKNDSLIYVETSDPLVLLAINGVTENTLWKTNMKSEVFGHCALSENMGYVGTLAGKFYGVDLKTGVIQWTIMTDGYSANHLKYYKPDDTYRDDIFSINKTNEDFIYSGYACGAIYSTAAISAEAIIISSTDGTVYCLKRN